MNTEEIKNKIEEVASDYGFPINKLKFSDDERYAILVNDDGIDLIINLDGLDQNNIKDKFIDSLKNALKGFDPVEQASR